MELNKYEDDISIYYFKSIINYIKNNWIQILLLIGSFFIIYIVDHICCINYGLLATTASISAPPMLRIKNLKNNFK